MPSLKVYRKRIVSVNNTKKITRAMKLVSAAKLRRAQDAALSHRAYADRLKAMLEGAVARSSQAVHPLMEQREGTKTLLVVVTSDRGLCGGFNSNISRKTERWLLDHKAQCELVRLRYVGRKGGDYFRVRPGVAQAHAGPAFSPMDPAVPEKLTAEVGRLYTGGQYDRIVLVYSKFISALTQEVVFEQLLPLAAPAGEGASYGFDAIYEPSREAVLNALVPAYVARRVGQAIYESIASEHGARMTAMEAATTNATQAVSRLTLQYNRARQAAITKELIEVLNGAESLKG